MAQIYTTNWGAVLLRGIIAILFGVVAILFPGATVAFLALMFGAYAFMDGVLALVSALRGGRHGHGWAAALEGVAGIAIGVLTFMQPWSTAVVLIYLIAGWAIVTGILEIITAVRFHRVLAGGWLLGIAGVASLVIGVLLVAAPAAGAVAIALWVGAYAIVFGVVLMVLALRLRSWRPEVPVTHAV